jgi:hypothetical protein
MAAAATTVIMKKWMLVLGVGAVLVAATQGRAQACGQGSSYGYGSLFAAVAIVGTVDIGFTLYDVSQLSQGRPGGKGAAVAELLLVAPQAVGFDSALLINRDVGISPGVVIVGIWLNLLAVHSVYALAATPRQETTPPPPIGLTVGRRGKQQVTFVPTLVGEGRAATAGLGAVGSF